MNNCKYCKYYREVIIDAKFTPVPVCTRHSDLKSQSEAIKNSDSCEFNIDVATRFKAAAAAVNGVSETFKKLGEAFKKLGETFETISEKIEKEAQNE